jgi:hypothetical protein
VEGPAKVDASTAGRRKIARCATQAAAAQRLDGRLMERKFKDPAAGGQRLYRGVLRYQGAASQPNYFIIERRTAASPKTLPAAQRCLLPAGAVMPAATAQEAQPQLSGPWRLRQPIAMRAMLQQLMPAARVPNYFTAEYKDGAVRPPSCPQRSAATCQKVQSCPLLLPRKRSRSCQVPGTSVSQSPCMPAVLQQLMPKCCQPHGWTSKPQPSRLCSLWP